MSDQRSDQLPTATTLSSFDDFITRWKNTRRTERANYQLFLTELCSLLGLPQPDPACEDTRDNAYVFERRVDIRNPDGTENRGYIDLYKRGCFVLEANQTVPDQVEAVRRALQVGPQTAEQIAFSFKRNQTKAVEQIPKALHVLGQAQKDGDRWGLIYEDNGGPGDGGIRQEECVYFSRTSHVAMDLESYGMLPGSVLRSA